ncbi:carboxylesterase family protein [Amycolatopsis rubida]|uniref:Deoxyribonuclease NucA/NucB n=1 Tax=Amycolatopsis rubida TaxID=112413 RepID=A0A1I5KG47_9PSEU|nr:carboxylesterase family protein [Amycolatopsis rubida]SFO84012.1 Deoxyribonuclease NucA/NucB [Amycolatopsis rubida]
MPRRLNPRERHVEVKTTAGTIRGALTGRIAAFKGIPYAEAPFGPNLFRPPVRRGSWEGVLECTDYGLRCPQPSSGLFTDRATGEDCLSVNVWAPRGASQLPVLFWIHGGGFLMGSNADPGPNGPHYVIVGQGKYPEAANHVREARMGTSWRGDQPFNRMRPAEVTVDRDGADERRAEAMKQVPQTRPGYDRDECPPAVFQEGGTGSSVKYIDPFDNQGSSIRHQISGLDDGEKVAVVAD